MSVLKFHIYVVGRTPKSEEAVNNLISILDEDFKDQYSLEVIDVMKAPQLAEKQRIFATPTVVKISPPPLRRIVGDFSKKETVLGGLGLMSDSKKKAEANELTIDD